MALSAYNNNNHKYASCPDWCISPHADRRHREIQIVYNTGCHRASRSLFLTLHTVRGCPDKLVTWG